MNIRVFAAARLNAVCRRQLSEQLRLGVDPAGELSRLNSIIGSSQLTLPDLQQLIRIRDTSSMLSALAPAEFSRVRIHVESGSRSALETIAADLQTELAETLAAATAVVTAATRDITADAFAESGLELGYAVTTHRAETATWIELCRGREMVLVAIHDGGNVEFDHSGLPDQTCLEQQVQLERAAGRRGVFVARCP